MNNPTMNQLWVAIHRVRTSTEGRSREVKNAVFREHFVDTNAEGDTAGFAKEEVAALLVNLRIERRP